MIEKIDHVGIAVKDLEKAMKIYTDSMGLKLLQVEVLEKAKVRIAFFSVGGVLVELLAPMSEEAGIAKHIAQKGEGLHHIAYRVKDIDNVLKNLKERGVKLTDEKSRPGGSGSLIAFLSSESTNDVLTELVQRERDLI